MSKSQILGIGAIVVIALIAIRGNFYPIQLPSFGAASPAGAYFAGEDQGAQQLSQSTSTVFLLQNTDGQDRTIEEVRAFIQTGATTTTYRINCATSSTPFVNANTNYVLSQNLQNIGNGTTTGGGLYFASTSPGVTGLATGSASTTARIWPSQSYLWCQEISSPANDLLPSSTDGVISFPYIQH